MLIHNYCRNVTVLQQLFNAAHNLYARIYYFKNSSQMAEKTRSPVAPPVALTGSDAVDVVGGLAVATQVVATRLVLHELLEAVLGQHLILLVVHLMFL